MLTFTLHNLYGILFIWIPIIVTISPILLFFIKKKKSFYWYFILTTNLLFFMFISLIFTMSNLDGDTRFRYLNEMLFWRIAFISTISALIIKLVLNSIQQKYINTLFQYLLTVKQKILFNLLKTLFIFIVFLQIFIIWTGTEAHLQAKKLHLLKGKTLLSFYQPFYKPVMDEIKIGNNLRWSFTRNKYVDRNK